MLTRQTSRIETAVTSQWRVASPSICAIKMKFETLDQKKRLETLKCHTCHVTFVSHVVHTLDSCRTPAQTTSTNHNRIQTPLAKRNEPGPRHGFHEPLRRTPLLQLLKGIIHWRVHLGLAGLNHEGIMKLCFKVNVMILGKQ